jgi:hypothetical protein
MHNLAEVCLLEKWERAIILSDRDLSYTFEPVRRLQDFCTETVAHILNIDSNWLHWWILEGRFVNTSLEELLELARRGDN